MSIATDRPSLALMSSGSTHIPVWSFSGSTDGQSVAGLVTGLPSGCAAAKVEIVVTTTDAATSPLYEDVYRVHLAQMVEGAAFTSRYVLGSPVRTALPAAPFYTRTIVLESYYPVEPNTPLWVRVQLEPIDPADSSTSPTGLAMVKVTPPDALAKPQVVRSCSRRHATSKKVQHRYRPTSVEHLPQRMKNTCSKSKTPNVNDNHITAPDALASQPWITLDDLTGDIERMIGILVAPYVADSNPLMHRDELKAKCRAKLAHIPHAGHLHKCPTRAKAFGFIKTSMRNHIMSLIQKFAFTEKRSGVKPPPKARRERSGDGSEHVTRKDSPRRRWGTIARPCIAPMPNAP